MANESPVGLIADFVLNVIESPQAQAELTTLATSGEAALKTAITDVLNNAKPTGIVGVVWPALKGSIGAYADSLIAKYTPEQIVAFLTKEAQLEAKALGG
mgnify:FL=1